MVHFRAVIANAAEMTRSRSKAGQWTLTPGPKLRIQPTSSGVSDLDSVCARTCRSPGSLAGKPDDSLVHPCRTSSAVRKTVIKTPFWSYLFEKAAGLTCGRG